MDYLNIARNIYAGSKYEDSEEDIKMLADNIALLETRGLDKLNQRLIDSGKRGIWNTIAEHNFAVILVSRHDSSVPICYEPDINGRPPDFKIEIGNVTYWIQMKDLARLERENRQDKTMQKIEAAAKEIKVGKFFGCMLSDGFKESSVPKLIEFMREKAAATSEGDSFIFKSENNQTAEIILGPPGRKTLSELTLGFSGDRTALNITGLDKEQIKQSLLKAAGAFNWETDPNNINLVAIEADGKEDIDICDALFGTEHEIARRDKNGTHHDGWSRDNDGLFKEFDFLKKVAGVIAIKRKPEENDTICSLSPDEVVSGLSPDVKEFACEHCGMKPDAIKEALEWKNPGPVADYYLILYMNDNFKHLLEGIQKLLSFDKVVYYDMRPPMGHGNFIA